MSKLEKTLLFLLVFLIPSNLALHLDNFQLFPRSGILGGVGTIFNFQLGNSVIDGITVDYLIPKVHLTDILILIIIAPRLLNTLYTILHTIYKIGFRSSQKIGQYTIYNILHTPHIYVATFFAITLIKVPFTSSPPAAFYFWFKLVEIVLLIWYLRSRPLFAIRYWLLAGLTLSVAFQSILALVQWIKQSSITPYWLLGESQFSATTPGIAKASFAGFLKVLPMGTTPHPNVLAGFIAISLIIIYITSPTRGKSKFLPNISKYIITILGIFTLLLTQALTAIIALALGLIFIITISPKTDSSTQSKLLPKTLIALGLSLLILWTLLSNRTILESTSLSRRQTLNTIAIQMIKDRPLFGVGLNNFTAVMKNYGDVESTTRFFQPAHNIYLLLISETGLIGFLLVTLIIWSYIKNTKYSIQYTIYFVPVLMLALIGAADHYPLTLQTGQLLLVLSLALTTKHNI